MRGPSVITLEMKHTLCLVLFAAAAFGAAPEAKITIKGEAFITSNTKQTRTIGGALVRVYYYDVRSSVTSGLQEMFKRATSLDQPKEKQLPTVMAGSVAAGITKVMAELPKANAQTYTDADGKFSLEVKKARFYSLVLSRDKYVWVIGGDDISSSEQVILSNHNLYRFQ